jgi:hypothetical protein
VQWEGGTYFFITGYVIRKYSNIWITNFIESLDIGDIKYSIYEIPESKLNRKEVFNYEGEIIEISNDEFANIKSKNDYFIHSVSAKLKLFDIYIPIEMLLTIHEDQTLTISFWFEYLHIQDEENLVKKKLKTEYIREFCLDFYSKDNFLYGFIGEEVSDISIIDIQLKRLYFETTDSFFSKDILSQERVNDLLNIDFFRVNEIKGNSNKLSGYFVTLGEHFHEHQNNLMISKFEVFLRNLEKDLRDKYAR